MDDRTLLERAARVAEVDGIYQFDRSLIPPECIRVNDDLDLYKRSRWNPLTDDGDALRLAVKLHLDVTMYPVTKEVGAIQHKHNGVCYGTVNRCFERTGTDPYAATRRAIVRAAAALAGD